MSRRKKQGKVKKLTPEDRARRAQKELRSAIGEAKVKLREDRETRARAAKSGIEIASDLKSVKGLGPAGPDPLREKGS
jgi:predicted flap endonuclease-1-like 5' DNA nuclease